MASIKPVYLTWLRALFALTCGSLITFSLAPYAIWPLGIASLVGLAFLLANQTAKSSFFIALLFGVGLYGTGASWVYVSIASFGNTSSYIATLMTAAFVVGLACAFALPFYFYGKYFKDQALGKLWAFPAIWFLGEWSRTWFLTGFPWLYVGYSHHATWLSGWASVIGVLGIGFICTLSATLILHLTSKNHVATQKIKFALGLCCLWGSGLLLTQIDWTTPIGSPQKVALIQPNIPQEMKWNPIYADAIFNTLIAQTQNHSDADMVIWPEAAIPVLQSDAQDYLAQIYAHLDKHNTAFITGILKDDIVNQKFYNTIIGLGEANGVYAKQRLVPFGEYVPLEDQLRGLINFFNLPMSVIHKGAKNQTLLGSKEYTFATSICYEIVYPSLVAKYARNANAIITISNDAWFGDSIGPIQHFEMARMRALENQKPVIRVANTGISGFIDKNGNTIAQTQQFERVELVSNIMYYKGTTPFSIFKSWPMVLFCFFIVGFLHIKARKIKDLDSQ